MLVAAHHTYSLTHLLICFTGGYTTNIKLGESPFSHVDHIHNAMKGSAEISTPSGVAPKKAGTLMGIWCDGQKWRARPDGYKSKGGEVIIAKGKRKRMDRDDEGALHQLDHVVRDALMSVLFEKRAHYRSQYDGDEKRQQKGRNERRSRQAKKGKAKLENSLMEQAQYRVLERVSSKEELESVLARPDMNSKVAKEELLKHQLLIRYNGFKSVPKKSWSCAEDGRKGTPEELQKTLEEVLEGEKTKPLKDRLEVQFDAPKQKVLGEEATHQRQQLDEQMKLKAAANIESSAEAAYLPRAVREWRGVGLREWPRSLTDDERKLTRGLRYTEDGKEWVVEGIDYCEEKGWVAYYYAATPEEAPVTLADCQYSSLREVVQWALEIELPVEAAPVAPAVAPAAPLAGGEMVAGELNKLRVPEP